MNISKRKSKLLGQYYFAYITFCKDNNKFIKRYKRLFEIIAKKYEPERYGNCDFDIYKNIFLTKRCYNEFRNGFNGAVNYWSKKRNIDKKYIINEIFNLNTIYHNNTNYCDIAIWNKYYESLYV